MPIIAALERRSTGGRLVIAGIYLLLICGGATMVYPFLLMVSTALTGETDYKEFRVVPRYFYDDRARYVKFLAEKYQRLDDFRTTRGESFRDFADAAEGWTGNPTPADTVAAGDLHDFERTLDPRDFGLWHVGRRALPGKAEMLWRDHLRHALDGDVERLSEAFGRPYRSFSEVFAPYEQPNARTWLGVPGIEGEWWDAFKRAIDPAYRRPLDAGAAWRQWLQGTYDRIEDANRALGTSYESFEVIPLPITAPDAPAIRDQWLRFVHAALPVHCIVSPNAATEDLRIDSPDVRFIAFIADRYDHDLAALNRAWGTALTSFAEVRPPYAAADGVEFSTHRREWMTWFVTRNFSEVFSFIAVRGRSLQNTAVLVLAMILASLTVNPLAAYALSRFELPYTNQVLIFLLATMAFPYEVTMIPGFLLLRNFPLWAGLAAVLVGGGVLAWSLRRRGNRSRWWGVAGGLAAGLLAAVATTRGLAWYYGSPGAASVSLLNTYAALILPGVASGYSIFLLKGFFDSLPEEVFEAARLDGASEMRMLWQIAVPLSTPILAVTVLFTFTATYGSYIWALVVCQDERMWTLMVHLFQLQQWAPTYVTMAANVVASIPTLLVFVLAQNMIMRGVILPAYK